MHVRLHGCSSIEMLSLCLLTQLLPALCRGILHDVFCCSPDLNGFVIPQVQTAHARILGVPFVNARRFHCDQLSVQILHGQLTMPSNSTLREEVANWADGLKQYMTPWTEQAITSAQSVSAAADNSIDKNDGTADS